MKRFIEKELVKWKDDPFRMPLLIRGARQVGKSFTVEKFGKEHFSQFVTVNFELKPELKNCFRTLEPEKILQELELVLGVEITPGKTLLFIDEVQFCPQAIASLRYFKELKGDLHVIAAGSLLEFALVDPAISFPVGRVQSYYMRPLSFFEFLHVLGEKQVCKYLEEYDGRDEISVALHEKLMELIKTYCIVGGMPGSVARFLETGSMLECQNYLINLIDLYRTDMSKYASKTQYRHLQVLFDRAPETVGLRFKYSHIDPDTRSRDLQLALDQLKWAGLLHQVYATSGAGVPLKVHENSRVQKLLYIDIGMLQAALRVDPVYFFREDVTLIHKGALAEQLVGQELIGYTNSHERGQLYFWERAKQGSDAEVDYLFSSGHEAIPIEVKAGAQGRLRSLYLFLEEKNASYGIRFYSGLPVKQGQVVSLPFYLISQLKRLVGKKDFFESFFNGGV